MFSPGIPSVNRAVLEKIGDNIEHKINSGSALIDKAIDSTGDVKSVRGAQLREFSQYLCEVDSKIHCQSLSCMRLYQRERHMCYGGEQRGVGTFSAEETRIVANEE